MRSIKKLFIILLFAHLACAQLQAMYSQYSQPFTSSFDDRGWESSFTHQNWQPHGSPRFNAHKAGTQLTQAEKVQGMFALLKLSNLLFNKREARGSGDFVRRLLMHGIRITCSVLDILNHPNDASYQYLVPWIALDVYRAIQDSKNLLGYIKGKKKRMKGGYEQGAKGFEEDALSNKKKPNNVEKNLARFVDMITPFVECGASLMVATTDGNDEADRLCRRKWNGICSMSRLVSELADPYNSKKMRAILALLLAGHAVFAHRDFDEYKGVKHREEEIRLQKLVAERERKAQEEREERERLRREQEQTRQRQEARRRQREQEREQERQWEEQLRREREQQRQRDQKREQERERRQQEQEWAEELRRGFEKAEKREQERYRQRSYGQWQQREQETQWSGFGQQSSQQQEAERRRAEGVRRERERRQNEENRKRQEEWAKKEGACRILGLNTDGVSRNAVDKAFRKLALKCHPDKNRGQIAEATAMMQKINGAKSEIYRMMGWS